MRNPTKAIGSSSWKTSRSRRSSAAAAAFVREKNLAPIFALIPVAHFNQLKFYFRFSEFRIPTDGDGEGVHRGAVVHIKTRNPIELSNTYLKRETKREEGIELEMLMAN